MARLADALGLYLRRRALMPEQELFTLWVIGRYMLTSEIESTAYWRTNPAAVPQRRLAVPSIMVLPMCCSRPSRCWLYQETMI